MSITITSASYDQSTGAVSVSGGRDGGVNSVKVKIGTQAARDATLGNNGTWSYSGSIPAPPPPRPDTVTVTVFVPGVPGKEAAIDIDAGLLASLAGVGVEVKPGLVGTRLTLRSAPAAT